MDETLIITVIRAQCGDTRAFDCLVRRFQDRAVAYARTLLHDPTAAEDAAQEAFVQAWRDLPRLAEPAAFSVWLRRIVFKFCDRVRRSAAYRSAELPLSEMLPLPKDQEPASLVVRADEAAQVRAAIDALPCPLREVTLLYYLTGCSVKEIAAFLETPPHTVKNRLHAARKRLRKELWTMAETILQEEKPSQNETFAGNVLARVLREFQQQEANDPHTADRGLLDEGRTALDRMLKKEAPLEEGSIRDGFLLLWRKQDWQGIAALLMRALTQPLSDSDTAWAYLHLANTIAIGGSAAGAVLAHEAFERWMPGRSPRLSARWPYYPVSDDAVKAEESQALYDGEEVRLLFLSQSAEFTTSYLKVWRGNDYLAKADAVLEKIPVSAQNRGHRFFLLRMAANACQQAEDLERAQRYVNQMHVLSEGAEDVSLGAEIKAKALGHEIDLARRRQDEEAYGAWVAEMMALLNATLQREPDARWLRGQRHDLACHLIRSGRYEPALALWEENLAQGGQVNGWGWLLHAATVWQVVHDRERTFFLLREARAHEDRDMLSLFTGRPEFADVRDDPEFRSLVER